MEQEDFKLKFEIPKYTNLSKDIKPFIRRINMIFDSQQATDIQKQIYLKLQLPDECLDFLEGKHFENYEKLTSCLMERYNGQISKSTAQSKLLSFQFQFNNLEQDIIKFADLVKAASSITDQEELLTWQLDRLTIQLGDKSKTVRDKLINGRRAYKTIQEAAADIACAVNMQRNESINRNYKKIKGENMNCSYCKRNGHVYDNCRKRLNLCLRCGDRNHKANECSGKSTMLVKTTTPPNEFFVTTATINGHKFQGLIDSGCDTTVIPEYIAKKFVDTENLKVVEIETAGKKTEMKQVHGCTDIEVEGFYTTIENFMISKDRYKYFEGIIGLNVLKKLNVVIDIENKMLLPKIKSNMKHIFSCKVEEEDLIKCESDFKNEIKKLMPNLNPSSEFDCGEGIAVAPQQQQINVKPLGIKYYTAPVSKDIQANIDEMLEHKIISRSKAVEVAPFYPIVKINKENNQPKKFKDSKNNEFVRMRILLDAREINNKTVKMSYEPTTAVRIIQHLKEFTYASVLDLHQAFFQVKLHPNNYNMFSFKYNSQTYSYNRLPQGAVNSPIIFQRTMELLLEEFKNKINDNNIQLEVYQDDIILLTNNDTSHHLNILKILLKLLNKKNVKLSIDKSKFLKTQVDYLSWTFQRNIVRPSDISILKLTKREFPKRKEQLYQFLQSLCYFKLTIKNWDIMTRSLYALTRGDLKSQIQWNDNDKRKFEELIKILLEKPYLHLKKEGLPIIMVVDASKEAVGGYIYQQFNNDRLILGHFCYVLGKSIKERSITYLELKAIAIGVETFKNLLCGNTLFVHSDHRPLSTLLNSKSITQPKHMELLFTIKQYVQEIIYLPGPQNAIADYISRITVSKGEGNVDNEIKEINFINAKTPDQQLELNKEIIESQKDIENYDIEINGIKYIKKINDNITQKERLIIPITDMKLAKNIIEDYHNSFGHTVGQKLMELIKRKYQIKNLAQILNEIIQSCTICQRITKENCYKPEFETISYPENVWEIIATDICIVAQYGKIIQFIDTLSRFWIPIVISNLSSEETVNVSIKEIFSRFGIPSKIVCDQGTNYKGFEFKNLCKSLGIEIHFCTPDHKTGNSISERSFRTMRTILMKIKAVADEDATFNFTDAVNFASYIYNTTECTTTKISPFMLMFGRYPNLNDFINIGFQNSIAIEKLKALRKIAQITSKEIRDYQNKTINEQRETPEIKVGDLVMVKNNTSTKIDTPYIGPYKVRDIKGITLSLGKLESTGKGRPLIRNMAQCKPYKISKGEE